MTPGLVKGLLAEGTEVRPVALPASVHLVLALILSCAGGPLGANSLWRDGVILLVLLLPS